MAAVDEFGYPYEIDPDAPLRLMAPVTLPATAASADHQRHADAYAVYQERIKDAVRARRHRPPAAASRSSE